MSERTRNPLRSTRPSLACVLLCALFLALVAGGAVAAFDLDELRARWSSLTRSERDVMRERYEHYRSLGAEQRADLNEKARRLDLLARRVYRSLDESERERLDSLEPKKRRELLREMAAEEARVIGQRIQAKLPAPVLERLEQASADDWVAFLDEFKRRQRERMGHVLADLGRELELEDAIVKRLASLDDEERGRKFLELMQRRSQRAVSDLPPGVTPERWNEIQNLPPGEFFEAVMELREAFPDFGRPPGMRPPPRSGPGEGGPGRVELPAPLAHELRRALRPSPRERLDLAELESSRRGVELAKLRRGRVIALLDRTQWLAPDERRRLVSLPDPRFFATVRSILRSAGPPAAGSVLGEPPRDE